MWSWRGWQSALWPAGPQAERDYRLFIAFLVTAAVVYVLVLLAIAIAAMRARRRAARGEAPPPDAERRMTRGVALATGLTAVILLGFLTASVATGRAMADRPAGDPLVVNVIGHQYWWEFEYEDTLPSHRLGTANELHVPVGRPVVFKITSSDVIHSFWVPNLGGKKDGIPAKTSLMWFRADTPGVFRGQCAEFCGHQHAKMGFMVVAQAPDLFRQWYEEQLMPAAAPADSVRLRGQEVFLGNQCIMCHTIRGTPAGASAGPDLTHIGSSLTIAAGTLPNTKGNLAGWIVDPQRIKPGAQMPPIQLHPQDLQALLAYLQGLK